jgi:hypothetical protein
VCVWVNKWKDLLRAVGVGVPQALRIIRMRYIYPVCRAYLVTSVGSESMSRSGGTACLVSRRQGNLMMETTVAY